MIIVYSIISIIVSTVLIGEIKDYRVSIQNLLEIILLSYLLYPLVRDRILVALRWTLSKIPRETEEE